MHTAIIALAFAAGLVSAAPAEQQPKQAPAAKVRVLIVTGVDTAHDWKKTGPVVRDILEQDRRIEARIVEDPEFLASPLAGEYDVILLEFYNPKPLRNQAQIQKNLVQWIEGGKGLVVLHFSCGAFADWPGFADLAGRIWDRKNYHDPRRPYAVKIVNREHPITRGMDDFQADDELYVCLGGDKPMELLATARSKVTGKDHPMALAMNYGKGRVFNTPLGHDGKAVAMPGVAKLLQRGVLWAAGREP
jgi:type 1 glutamine amidotransferase